VTHAHSINQIGRCLAKQMPGRVGARSARTSPALWKRVRNAAGDTVKSQRVGGCEKSFQLSGKHGSVVPLGTEACRYFQRRES